MSKKSSKRRRSKQKKKAKRVRQKGGRARAFLWWLVGICTALLFMMVFVLSDHGLYELWKLKRQQHTIENNIQSLEDRNAKLTVERDKLKNDMEYIEKLAREKYRMAKKGEKVFRVIPRESTRHQQR